MKNFMIGHYGSFDYSKQKRDFRDEFYGIEACLIENEEDIDQIIKESKAKRFQVCVHFPLRPDKIKLRDPLFLSLDENTRKEAYDYMQNEFDFLTKVKPTYVLFHYPKPVILDDRVDWTLWRFGDKREYAYESDYSFEEFKLKSDSLFEWLTKKSEEYHFTPVLELDALNKYIYQTELLEDLLNKYDRIKLCLDTGRIHLQDRLDPNFNGKQIIKKYAKYAEVIHLWSVKVTTIQEYNHYPALQDLKPEEGWAPLEEYIQIIKEQNPNVKIMFEHRSDLISEDQLDQCYEWVDDLFNS